MQLQIYYFLISRYNRELSIKPWPSNKQSTIFINSPSYFEFLRDWILSRKEDPIVCVLTFLCSARSRCLLNFFLLNLFLDTLGNFSTYLFSQLCCTALSNWVKTSPDSSKILPKNWCFYNVYKQSTVWYK